ARNTSPGPISITRPVGDSTVIGSPSRASAKAQTSPSLPHVDCSRISSSGGTRRSTEVRLILAGRLSTSHSRLAFDRGSKNADGPDCLVVDLFDFRARFRLVFEEVNDLYKGGMTDTVRAAEGLVSRCYTKPPRR